MKKAQVPGQIFIYIIAIVVVGFIVVYGYSSIKTFTAKGEQVEYISFKTAVENSIKSLASDYGSVKRPDIGVPSKYTHVCFVDKSNYATGKSNPGSPCNQNPEETHSPVACSGWENGRNNVFLLPDGSDSFDVGNIAFGPSTYSVCLKVVNGKIPLQLEGLGDKVMISNYTV